MPDYLKLILILLSWLAIAFACHMYIKRYFLASLVGAIAIMIFTQIMGYIEVGFLDPFWFIGAITSFFMGSLVTLTVGLPFRLIRNLEKEPSELSGFDED